MRAALLLLALWASVSAAADGCGDIAIAAVGGACADDSECARTWVRLEDDDGEFHHMQQICKNGNCANPKMNIGEACMENFECFSGACRFGACAAAGWMVNEGSYVVPGTTCENVGRTDTVTAGGGCVDKKADGTACHNNRECMSGVCGYNPSTANSECAAVPGAGEACDSDMSVWWSWGIALKMVCPAGHLCIDGSCGKFANGEACQAHTDCESSFCDKDGLWGTCATAPAVDPAVCLAAGEVCDPTATAAADFCCSAMCNVDDSTTDGSSKCGTWLSIGDDCSNSFDRCYYGECNGDMICALVPEGGACETRGDSVDDCAEGFNCVNNVCTAAADGNSHLTPQSGRCWNEYNLDSSTWCAADLVCVSTICMPITTCNNGDQCDQTDASIFCDDIDSFNICGSPAPAATCAADTEACTTFADCCDGLACITTNNWDNSFTTGVCSPFLADGDMCTESLLHCGLSAECRLTAQDNTDPQSGDYTCQSGFLAEGWGCLGDWECEGSMTCHNGFCTQPAGSRTSVASTETSDPVNCANWGIANNDFPHCGESELLFCQENSWVAYGSVAAGGTATRPHVCATNTFWNANSQQCVADISCGSMSDCTSASSTNVIGEVGPSPVYCDCEAGGSDTCMVHTDKTDACDNAYLYDYFCGDMTEQAFYQAGYDCFNQGFTVETVEAPEDDQTDDGHTDHAHTDETDNNGNSTDTASDTDGEGGSDSDDAGAIASYAVSMFTLAIILACSLLVSL